VETFRPNNTQDSSQPPVTIVGEEPGFRSPKSFNQRQRCVFARLIEFFLD
jgi:hypothetical protein